MVFFLVIAALTSRDPGPPAFTNYRAILVSAMIGGAAPFCSSRAFRTCSRLKIPGTRPVGDRARLRARGLRPYPRIAEPAPDPSTDADAENTNRGSEDPVTTACGTALSG